MTKRKITVDDTIKFSQEDGTLLLKTIEKVKEELKWGTEDLARRSGISLKQITAILYSVTPSDPNAPYVFSSDDLRDILLALEFPKALPPNTRTIDVEGFIKKHANVTVGDGEKLLLPKKRANFLITALKEEMNYWGKGTARLASLIGIKKGDVDAVLTPVTAPTHAFNKTHVELMIAELDRSQSRTIDEFMQQHSVPPKKSSLKKSERLNPEGIINRAAFARSFVDWLNKPGNSEDLAANNVEIVGEHFHPAGYRTALIAAARGETYPAASAITDRQLAALADYCQFDVPYQSSDITTSSHVARNSTRTAATQTAR